MWYWQLVFAAVVLQGFCAVAASPDVFIGSSGLGHVTPAATFPFGMVQAGPDTSAKPDRFSPDWPHTCGYQHGDMWLWRFSQTHISGTGCASFGDVAVLPVVEGFDGLTTPAKMLKTTERAEPGYYAVGLEENAVRIFCEMTVLAHTAAYRFAYPKGARARILVDLDWGIGSLSSEKCWNRRVLSSRESFPSETELHGWREVWCWNDYRLGYALSFSAPIAAKRQLRQAGDGRGSVYELDFGTLVDGVLELRIGLSSTSVESAVANLTSEMPRFDFASAHRMSRNAWKDILSRLEIDPKTDKDIAANFHAALYRTLLQPNDLGDVGGKPAYSTFSLWDTFRAAHPLYTLVAPERVAGMVNSMLDQYDRQGYLPIWALGGSENHCMIGHHAVPVIADACLKGVRGVDWERAWRAVKDSLTRNHKPVNDGTWGLVKEDWDILDKYGYYPFDLIRGSYGKRIAKGESVARTLECAYDDACAARLAAHLGKTEEAEFFRRRSGNWRNVFDASVGFMRGKDSNGRWREPFDPHALGGGPWTDNDFCEGNSWQYTWHVMHDPEGLIAAFGGREKFLAKLVRLFEQDETNYEVRPTADVTGLIGEYAHGNEPSHHTIYFLTLAGRPDLAARYVRHVFETQYFNRPDGLCGNDDCGQMAAWYVFSALGFYPFDPCGGEYVLGAPQVPAAQVKVKGEDGQWKQFTMTARGLSKDNKYVKTVTLNGRPVADWKIRHADIVRGGELVFEMCAKP